MNRLLWLASFLLLVSCAHQPRPSQERRASRDGLAGGQGGVCKPLSAADRMRLLEEADPANFPATRYRKGANPRRGIERETDCSLFVHEIYRRAGLPYSFRTTHGLREAEEFEVLPESEAKPGDLMLFRGHVGIIDSEGKIISALRTRRRARRSSIESIGRENFRTYRGRRYVLRYRCRPQEDAVERRTASSGPREPLRK